MFLFLPRLLAAQIFEECQGDHTEEHHVHDDEKYAPELPRRRQIERVLDLLQEATEHDHAESKRHGEDGLVEPRPTQVLLREESSGQESIRGET